MKIKTEISSIDGNFQMLDGGAMFGNAPRPMWEKWMTPDPLGRIELATRALLIEHDQTKILCETGVGSFFEPKLGERFGVKNQGTHMLLKNLEQKGISHEQIDYVILSHLHFDHAGGLLPTYEEIQQGNSDLLFPNAKYVVSKIALERCQKPHFRDRASFIPQLDEKLIASKRLIVVEGDFIPGVLEDRLKFIHSNGHTPGQLHTLFRGDEKTVFFCGDLIPGTPWVHVAITMGYDRYAELVIDEKSEVLSQAKEEGWIMFYTHDPEIVASTIEKNERGKYISNQKFNLLNQTKI